MSSWCSKCDFQECGPLGVHKCYCGHFRRDHVCDEPSNAKLRAVPPSAAQLEANRGTVASLEDLKKNTSAESGADQGICPTCNKIFGWEPVLLVNGTRQHKTCASSKICAKCKGPVGGAYVGSGGQYFHKECAGLTGICPGCNQTLAGQMVTVAGRKYHANCLNCAGCKKNVVNGFLQRGELVGKFEEKYNKWTTAIFGGGQPSSPASASSKWAVTKPPAKDEAKEKEKKAAEKAAREAEMREQAHKEKEAKDKLKEAKEKEKAEKLQKEKAEKDARASQKFTAPLASPPPLASPSPSRPVMSSPPALPSAPRTGPSVPQRATAGVSSRMSLPPRTSPPSEPALAAPVSPLEARPPPRALSPSPPMRSPPSMLPKKDKSKSLWEGMGTNPQPEAEPEQDSDRKIITFRFGEEVKKIRLPPLTVKLAPLHTKLLKAFPVEALSLSFMQGGIPTPILTDEMLMAALTSSDVILCAPASNGALLGPSKAKPPPR